MKVSYSFPLLLSHLLTKGVGAAAKFSAVLIDVATGLIDWLRNKQTGRFIAIDQDQLLRKMHKITTIEALGRRVACVAREDEFPKFTNRVLMDPGVDTGIAVRSSKASGAATVVPKAADSAAHRAVRVWTQKLSALKIRKGSVIALEEVLYMTTQSREHSIVWAQAVFLASQDFCGDRLIGAYYNGDLQTPELHLFIIPLVKTIPKDSRGQAIVVQSLNVGIFLRQYRRTMRTQTQLLINPRP